MTNGQMINGIEAKVALAFVTLSEAKSLVPRMTGSLLALSWTVSTCPEPTGTGYRARNGILRTVLDGQHLSWTDKPLVLWPRDKGYRVQGRSAPQNDRSQPTDR